MATRVGFIGSGGIAGHHMRQLETLKGVSLVAFTDVDRARAQACAEHYKGTAYTSYEKMLAGESLDCVYICTPPHVHGEIEYACVDAKLPMFIEKPIANNLPLAKKIAKKIAESGLITSVGYNWRYIEATLQARKALKGKTVCMALGSWCGGFPGVPWWRKRAQGGGQNIEQTTHIFDLLRYLCGEVTHVQAVYAKRVMHTVMKGANVDDVGSVNLRLASGAVANIVNCCCARNWGMVGLKVVTHDIVCEIDGGSGVFTPAEGERLVIPAAEGQAARTDAAFIAAVKKGKQELVASSYADALKSFAVTIAAEQAAASKETVRVPKV
jgi:myo-inositol 2-dehydrogenase / D-chiro-inositol 1-dehydrogenase